MANENLINTIRLKLRVRPQCAKVIAELASNPGQFFSTEDILRIIDYVPTEGRVWSSASASQAIIESRAAFRDWQIRANIATLQKTGYVMTPESAQSVMDFIA